MSALIIAGFVMVMATLLTLARLDILKVLGYSSFVDIIFTIILFTMFGETYSGIIASAFAGVFMTIMLYIMRGSVGAKKLTPVFRTYYGIKVPVAVTWKFYPASHFRRAWFKQAFKEGRV